MLALLGLPLAWLQGGHPERLAVAGLLISFVSTIPGSDFQLGGLFLVDAISDLGLTLLFGWMAFRRDRWWLFAMTGVMVLTVMVHLSTVVVPGMDLRAAMSARVGLGLLTFSILFLGVAECWLAGEAPVSAQAFWRRRLPDER